MTKIWSANYAGFRSDSHIYVATRGKIFLRVVYNVEIFSTNIFIQSKILRFHEILYPWK